MEKRIRARVRDLAPFASAEEDLSDERESSPPSNYDDNRNVTLINIIEEKTEQDANETNATVKMKAISSTTSTRASATMSTTAVASTTTVTVTVTPRIDISRASSSSYQEDSSPERELILGKSKGVKLETAFGEEMTSDLHSSTEELTFHHDTVEEEDEDEEKKRRMRKSSSRTTTPFSELWGETALRKDSACSVGGGGVDIALLSIGGSGLGFFGGRTSRVSSVGSVASGGSVSSNFSAASHGSALSHLSANSNLSRGSSPHRMSLETSFCGPKPVLNSSCIDDETADESVVAAMAAATATATATKNIVPVMTTKATSTTPTTPPIIIVAAGTSVAGDKPNSSEKKESRKQTKTDDGNSKKIDSRKAKTKQHKRKKPVIGNPKTQLFISLFSDDDDDEDEPSGGSTVPKVVSDDSRSNAGVAVAIAIDPSTQKFIPLKDYSDEERRPQKKNEREHVLCDDTKQKNRLPRPLSYQRSQENGGPTRRCSEKRAKPFTNKTLINFINKYDVSRYSNVGGGVSQRESDYQNAGKINEEFQTFISLKDEDDRERSTASGSVVAVDSRTRKSASSENEVIKGGRNCSAPKEGRKKHFKTTSAQIQVHDDKSEGAPGGDKGDNVTTVFSLAETGHKFNLIVDDDVHENSITSGCRRNEEVDHLNRSHSHDLGYDHDHNHNHGHSHHSRSHSHSHSQNLTHSNNSECVLRHCQKLPPTRGDRKSDEDLTSPAESRTELTVVPPDQLSGRSVSEGQTRTGMETVITGETYNGVLSYDSQLNLMNRKGSANVEYGSKGLTRSGEVQSEPVKERTPDGIGDKCRTDTWNMVQSERSSTSVQREFQNHRDQHVLRSFRKSNTKDETDLRLNHERRHPNETKTLLSRGDEIKNFNLAFATEHKSMGEEKGSGEEEGEEEMEEEEQKLQETDTSNDADTNALAREVDLSRTPENEEEHENLVNREESFEELPYVPTTLPLERPVAAPIVPVKERATKIEIHSVERPHSHSSTSSQNTTFELQWPADAAALMKSYTKVRARTTIFTTTTTTTTSTTTTITTETITTTRQNHRSETGSDSIKKLHITLPWTDSGAAASCEYVPYAERRRSSCSKPKRKTGAQNENKFSDTGGRENRFSPPPPLPPRRSNSWILFDDVRHESRQSPKQITTLPPTTSLLQPSAVALPSLPPQLPSSMSSSTCNLTRATSLDAEARNANRIVTVAAAKDIIFVTANECSCECHETLPPSPPIRDPFYGHSL